MNLRIIKSSTINVEKFNHLDISHRERLIDWMIKYQSPLREASLFKGIPNTPYHKAMINVFRSVAKRSTTPAWDVDGSAYPSGAKVTYRIKGRGPRTPYKYTNPWATSNLQHKNAETFALYQHFDTQYQ